MASQMAILTRTRTLFKSPTTKSITTFTFLSQEPQLVESTHSHSPSPPPPPPTATTPLPPNPTSSSPLYNKNWHSPIANSANSLSLTQSLMPLGFLAQSPNSRIQALSQTLDVESIMNVFANWMASQRWGEMKQLFEFWIQSLDRAGKPNKPDVGLYNNYLRAILMTNASAAELLNLVAQMEDYNVVPNTASFNLVLKAMYKAKEGKLLCSPELQGQHANLVLPANKSTPTHNKLLTSAGLPAHHKNRCSPNNC